VHIYDVLLTIGHIYDVSDALIRNIEYVSDNRALIRNIEYMSDNRSHIRHVGCAYPTCRMHIR